jgi:hypothetical protein
MSTFFEQIFIGSKFDAKGFKQAETALGKLNGSAKKLAGTFGLAFGAAAITSYGKAAVKAFAADEAAALRLNRAVENLGIGFANPAIADYIAKLEKSASVADDILRPAFQGLLTTTGSLTQSQKLLNDAITISRGSGIDLATVTDDLGKGYIGITKGLTKYNTGLTKAELQSKSFSDILGVILAKSAGAAEDYLETTSYKMDTLSIATGNASEIIGGGFVEALARAAGGTEASDAAIFLETMAGYFNKVTLAAGTSAGAIPTLAQNLKKLGKEIFFGFAGKQVGVNIVPTVKKEELKLTLSEKKQQELLAKMEKEALRREKERLALLNKQNAAKKLQGLIDKANLALGKGEGVFDLDKIQIAAALTNQAEQLGKATNGAQLLQIANDTARLNVKNSMLALEDAIASKDAAAIIAATAKLNEDLKILGALTNQKTQMVAIESILSGLKPKDLIDQENLNEALRKIRLMMEELAKIKFPTITSPSGGGGGGGGGGGFIQGPNGISPTSPARSIAEINKANEDLGGVISVIGENGKEFIKLIDGLAPVFQTIEDSGAFNALVNSFANGTIGSFGAGSARMGEGGSIFNSGAVGSRDRDINITIQANTIANPDELTSMIQNSIISLNKRGDYLNTAGAL